MRTLQRPAHVPHDLRCAPRRQRAPFLQQSPQIAAVHVIHRVKQQPVARLAKVQQFHDVRVIQPGHGPGFAVKAPGELRIQTQLPRQHFDSHTAVQRMLPAFIDRSHAPAAQQFLHVVALHLCRQFGRLRVGPLSPWPRSRRHPRRQQRTRLPGRDGMNHGGLLPGSRIHVWHDYGAEHGAAEKRIQGFCQNSICFPQVGSLAGSGRGEPARASLALPTALCICRCLRPGKIAPFG